MGTDMVTDMGTTTVGIHMEKTARAERTKGIDTILTATNCPKHTKTNRI